MNQQNNVTGTGIAVALAVIIVVGAMFFSPEIVSYFNSHSLVASTTAATTQTTATTMNDNQTSGADNAAASSSNPFGLPAEVTQLLMRDITVGTGAEAKTGDTVTVQYVGMLTNGTQFDASANHGTQGFTFTLGAGQVIKGWDQGVVGMKVGGKRELVIPASLGYGSQAVGPIPANSTLVFEVELQNVQPAAGS